MGEFFVQNVYLCEKGVHMNPHNQPQRSVKLNPSSVFSSAVLLSVAGLSIERIVTTSVGKFFGGLLIGLSIACIVLGFVMYAQAKKE
jgi:hypothetical protein